MTKRIGEETIRQINERNAKRLGRELAKLRKQAVTRFQATCEEVREERRQRGPRECLECGGRTKGGPVCRKCLGILVHEAN